MVHEFGKQRLRRFGSDRNDPNANALSNLSPWFHFGQISVQATILTLRAEYQHSAGASLKDFIEEALVRRELADNYCFYQTNYDNLQGAAGWAQESLQLHSKDKRDHLYTRAQLEAAETHDDLWNAAQIQVGKARI